MFATILRVVSAAVAAALVLKKEKRAICEKIIDSKYAEKSWNRSVSEGSASQSTGRVEGYCCKDLAQLKDPPLPAHTSYIYSKGGHLDARRSGLVLEELVRVWGSG